MSTTVVAILTAIISAAGASGLGVVLIRKKTRAETADAFADAASKLAQGAGDLVTSNAARIADLERRLTIAEQAAVLAHQTALLARESEQRCLVRLEAMDAQIAEMRQQIAHPPVTTTVTTAVTTQEPPA